MNLSKLKNDFDNLSERAQWEWVVENREVVNEIIVDNDNTSIFLQITPARRSKRSPRVTVERTFFSRKNSQANE